MNKTQVTEFSALVFLMSRGSPGLRERYGLVLLEITGEARVARRRLETVATWTKRGGELVRRPLWDVLTC
jgi:hypothetical protein